MFPIEVWEKIFQKIKNPEDLSKLKPVCKNWNLSIERILNRKIVWKNHCFTFIPREYIFPLLIHMSAKSMKDTYNLYWHLNRNDTMWRQVYYSWKKWQLCIKREDFIDKIIDVPMSQPYEQITCLATYHEILGIATNEGFIHFYKIHDLKTNLYKANHTEFITQLIFWNTDVGDLIAVSRSVFGKVRFWNVIKQQEVKGPVIRGDLIIIHTYGCYVQYKNTILTFSYFDNNQIRVSNEYLLGLSHNVSVITAIVYAKSILMLASEHSASCNTVRFYDMYFDVLGSVIRQPERLILPKELRLSNYQKFYFFSKTMIVVLSVPFIMFCINRIKWRSYNLFSQLHGIVQSVCYHCKMLMFGLDSGVIYIFHVKKESDLIAFNFSPRNSKKIVVDNKPITSLNITGVHDEQFIIATTNENVHVIRFF